MGGDPLFPRSIFLLFEPRQEAAIQQAEEIDIEKLVSHWNISEICNLNNRPYASFQNQSWEEIPFDILLYLRSRLPISKAHVTEKYEQIQGPKDNPIKSNFGPYKPGWVWLEFKSMADKPVKSFIPKVANRSDESKPKQARSSNSFPINS